MCLGPPRVVQSADRSDITVLTDTCVTTRPSATMARSAGACGGSGAVCRGRRPSILTGTATTTRPSATVASLVVRVEAVVQCV